ncbi:MAG: IS1634 family transposase [Oxalobacteraceae bacterium]|nr:IS1634 family transposase [Oxalobacteraceae bacterium]
MKQTTLLNLGSHFDVPQADWPALAARIDALLHGQAALQLEPLSEAVETIAQRCAAQLIALQSIEKPEASPATTAEPSDAGRFQEVDLDSIEMVRPRSVGVEHAALSAMRQCGFEDKLAELGFNRPQIAAAVGNIIGRMAHPGSELATHAWLQKRSALGELIDFDFEAMDLNRLYRASDALYKHRDALQDHLFGAAKSVFGFTDTVTLYDLTNTYFEGIAAGVGKAARGRSKEKRSDCPLVTLAVVLDGSGFVRRSRVFAGNASEPQTLQEMLTGLSAPKGAAVVMDAGIATEANLAWLKTHGYHYVVVSRKRERQFDPEMASEVQTAGDVTIKIHRVVDADNGEAHLYCHSPAREQKDRAIDDAKSSRFEATLQKLADGLGKSTGAKAIDKVTEKIGRAKQKYARAAQHYQINVVPDESGKNVAALTWEKHVKQGSAAMYPGVYCLRTTLIDLDDATLWRTYTMLTNLESVFRSLKTDLGLRPVYHQVERRVEGHLFISVLAYHFVHTLRLQLKAQGIDDAWESLRETLAGQQRITTTLQRRDGRAVHVRKATRPEPHQQKIAEMLGLAANPGGTHRAVI